MFLRFNVAVEAEAAAEVAAAVVAEEACRAEAAVAFRVAVETSRAAVAEVAFRVAAGE